MKKSFKKLTLNKQTISNLNSAEMQEKIGGITGTRCVSAKGLGNSCKIAICTTANPC